VTSARSERRFRGGEASKAVTGSPIREAQLAVNDKDARKERASSHALRKPARMLTG